MWHMTGSVRGVARAAVIGAAVLLMLGACDRIRNDLLEAPDPDIINPGSVNSPEAAEALRIGALSRLRNITAGGESAWLLGGLLSDEWRSGDTFLQRNETDQRQIQENNGNVNGMMREIYRARNTAREALIALETYKPTPTSNLGQMYFVLGFAEITLAETFCNGTPLGNASTGVPEYGPPQPNQAVFQLALAHFDSALTLSAATDAFSTSVRHSAAIGKARALTNLGQFAAAASAAAGVPTDFQSNATFALTSGDNQIWSLNNSAKRWVVGDSFDVAVSVLPNSLPFASAGDPRVVVTGTSTGTSPAGKAFDGSTNLVTQGLWGRSQPTPIVSGIDARLYEAEAALQADNIGSMMTILNDLRAAPRNLGVISTPAMAALPTPASRDAAIDLLFREKAFWTFGRGQRLGSLRRLVRQYQRNQANVFPTGTFFKGGTHGTDVNFPVHVDELNNPEYSGCIDRNA
jgi:hypothetical protein